MSERESSYALPAYYYSRDPADVVERNQLNELGCRACVRAVTVFGRIQCSDRRNEKQKGVPGIGHRCKLFKERNT